MRMQQGVHFAFYGPPEEFLYIEVTRMSIFRILQNGLWFTWSLSKSRIFFFRSSQTIKKIQSHPTNSSRSIGFPPLSHLLCAFRPPRSSPHAAAIASFRTALQRCVADLRALNIELLERLDAWQSSHRAIAAASSSSSSSLLSSSALSSSKTSLTSSSSSSSSAKSFSFSSSSSSSSSASASAPAPAPPLPFEWCGFDYVRKLHSDLAGIDASPAAAACVGFRVADNVFLLPSPEGALIHWIRQNVVYFCETGRIFESIFQYSFLF
jgi:hypothetical protein